MGHRAEASSGAVQDRKGNLDTRDETAWLVTDTSALGPTWSDVLRGGQKRYYYFMHVKWYVYGFATPTSVQEKLILVQYCCRR